MTDELSDVRQRKVRELIRDDFEGKQVAFADKIGRPDNYVSRIVSAGDNRKGIGERMARHIEKTCGKPRGWLDGEAAAERVAEPTILAYGMPISPSAADVGRDWEKLHEPLSSQIRELIRTLVRAQILEERQPRRGKGKPPHKRDDRPRPQ